MNPPGPKFPPPHSADARDEMGIARMTFPPIIEEIRRWNPTYSWGDVGLFAASSYVTRGATHSGYRLRMARKLSPFPIFDGPSWWARKFQAFRYNDGSLSQSPRLVPRLSTPPKPNFSGGPGYYDYLSKLAA